MTHVIVVSHNNAAEGAPRLCLKLATALHRAGGFARVFLCALADGPTPDERIPAFGLSRVAQQAAAILRRGGAVTVILSTVICARLAPSFRARADPEGRHADRLRVVGLIHEVRNETFAWVRPADLAGLDRAVFVARYTADSYDPSFAPGLRREVILNWLTPDDMRRIDAIPEERADSRVILAVGVVAKHKGQLHLARAVAALRRRRPGYRLVLAGHVYDPAYARLVAEQDPGGVELAGALAQADVLRHMRSCAVFVHGSPMESCCLSILEAMYAGCAVVAARVGGVPEQITDGRDGLLYQHDDHEACAAALERLLERDDERRRIGASARETVVARFSEPDKVAMYAPVLRQDR